MKFEATLLQAGTCCESSSLKRAVLCSTYGSNAQRSPYMYTQHPTPVECENAGTNGSNKEGQ